MSDRIPSVGEGSQDRAQLNVGGALKKNKSVIIGLFILVAMIVIAVALVMASGALEKAVSESPPLNVSENNHMAGSEKSTIRDSEQYFTEIRKRALEEEAKKEVPPPIEVESKTPPPPVPKVTPPPNKPAPKVVRKSSTPSRPIAPAYSPQEAELTPQQRKMSGPVVVAVKSDTGSGGFGGSDHDKRFDSPSFKPGKAVLRGEGALDFMLMHGTAIPCAIYTQIISDYSGYVTCQVIQDIYSANGAALLVERGSKVSGTQSVAMEQGKARIFTTWADIETPTGVTIRIDSLGTGALGAAGHEAWVDNHFAQRFGGAIMLSFVDDALATLSSQIKKNGNVTFDNSTKNASDMASKALEASIDIPPTGYSYIGQRINILIARDIDMSSVYEFSP